VRRVAHGWPDGGGLVGQSPDKPLNVHVVMEMDVDAFWEAMFVAVDNASAACPLR
jgi:hypothetical protein